MQFRDAVYLGHSVCKNIYLSLLKPYKLNSVTTIIKYEEIFIYGLKYLRKREREREWERKRDCVWEREKEKKCVCECEKERDIVCEWEKLRYCVW